MYIHLRERKTDAFLRENGVYYLIEFIEHVPVVLFFHPDTYHIFHCAVLECIDCDERVGRRSCIGIQDALFP